MWKEKKMDDGIHDSPFPIHSGESTTCITLRLLKKILHFCWCRGLARFSAKNFSGEAPC